MNKRFWFWCQAYGDHGDIELWLTKFIHKNWKQGIVMEDKITGATSFPCHTMKSSSDLSRILAMKYGPAENGSEHLLYSDRILQFNTGKDLPLYHPDAIWIGEDSHVTFDTLGETKEVRITKERNKSLLREIVLTIKTNK